MAHPDEKGSCDGVGGGVGRRHDESRKMSKRISNTITERTVMKWFDSGKVNENDRELSELCVIRLCDARPRKTSTVYHGL